MIIKNDNILNKPKNYSRYNLICSCKCPIYLKDKIYSGNSVGEGLVDVKYKIKIDKSNNYTYTSNYNIIINSVFKKFKKFADFDNILKLPKIFENFYDDDIDINVDFFIRDNIKVPFISSILVNDIHKYNKTKLKNDRMNKLIKINSMKSTV